MAAQYREILDHIRLAFPQPISNRVHDSYFVHSIMRAIDAVDMLKSERPILGERAPLDYETARRAAIPDSGSSVEDVTANLVTYCEGLTLWGHPRTQQNVVPPATISSLIGVLLSSMYNPNLAWDEYSHRFALAEVEMVSMMARLIGYDPERASGVFTFGGTGTTLYGIKAALVKTMPGSMEQGIREDAVIFASDCSHYCRYNIAGWLGLGSHNLITIPTDSRNAMDMSRLRESALEVLQGGKKIAAFIATMGTTDAFGLDDLRAIVSLRDELVETFELPYVPHVHADAVIGWAWSVFNDYDFETNVLGFRPRTIRALAGACHHIRYLYLADSAGIDFHKPGFTPYISSLVLFKEGRDLTRLSRPQEQMPYLYQFGEHRPGMYTMETSRSGTGVLASLANMKLFGKEGLRVILGHIVEMAELLSENLQGHACTTVLNRDNFGTVTLFRAYPEEVDTFKIQEQELTDPAFRPLLLQHNEYNRKIYHYVHKEGMAGRGVVLSMTDCYRQTAYGEPVAALKSFILSPFVDEENVQAVVRKVLEAREKVRRESPTAET
ncbi:MAG: pyridoxal-dependent decarboxylase [Nitrospirales bacterium]|nr:aspartate aminotransferase family protein [Nitrospira sp.]MDR4502416.1 pyridoxal-dependent decarboxylase [Nitrospirales bacterium]